MTFLRRNCALVLALGALVVMAGAASCTTTPAPPDARPNVLLIVVDTLRWDYVGCYGAERDTTPAVDALAREAVRFERAYAPTGWTSPSVASIITGQFPSRHTVTSFDRQLPDDAVTLAEMLASEGYATGATVANRHLGRKHNFTQGYDVYLTDHARGHDYVSTPGITDQAIELLEGFAEDARPFLLYVHYFDPHYNYRGHAGIDWAGESAGRLTGNESAAGLNAIADDMTDEELQFLLDLYAEEVRFTDDGIGRLLDRLASLGLDENTIVVFTSDHGEEFLTHGWIGHTRTLYDELVRVPLVVRAPGVPGGVVLEDPVSLVSVTPTLLDLVGVESGERSFQAPSLASALRESQGPGQQTIFCEVDFVPLREGSVKAAHKKAVVHDGRKLVRDDPTGVVELYDLAADPHELSDLAGDDPDGVAALVEVLDDAIESAREGALSIQRRSMTEDELERLRALGYVGGP